MEEFKEIMDMIADVSICILAINVFLFFKSYRNKTVAFKIIAFYLLFILITELRMSYLGSLKENNLHLSHFYFIGQLVFLSFFFMQELKNKALSKRIKTYLLFALIALGISYSLNPESYEKHNTFEVVITSVPLLVYCFIFFTKRIESSNSNFMFFNAGLFLYILCSTLLFVAGNVKAGIKLYIWAFNVVLYLIYQLCILLEWYKNVRTKNRVSARV
jgi:membrane associated rhomboid family serine protease